MCFVGSLLKTVRPKSPCLGPDLPVLTPLPVMSQSFSWWSVAHNQGSEGFWVPMASQSWEEQDVPSLGG